jgi:hypothetical protein
VNYLLDVSALLALCYEKHVHHDRAEHIEGPFMVREPRVPYGSPSRAAARAEFARGDQGSQRGGVSRRLPSEVSFASGASRFSRSQSSQVTWRWRWSSASQ